MTINGDVKMTKTSEINLTPEIAKQLLSRNTNNRPLNNKRVQRYAEDMKHGRWKFNGDTIKIDRNGILFDGQHRCSAVILSGVTIKVILVENLPSDTFDTIDIGKSRTAADILAISGEKNYSHLSAACKVAYCCMNNYLTRSVFLSEKFDHQTMLAFLKENPEIRNSVSFSRKIGNKKLMPYSVMTACHYMFSMGNRELSDRFFTSVIDGDLLEKGSVVFLLRSKLVSNLADHKKLSNVYLAAITIKAWNSWSRGEYLGVLKWTNLEDFPLVKSPK